jgi:hypothetical protein
MSSTQNRWPPMGQLLVQRGHVTSAQLEAALVEQQETGERLGEILVKHEHISRFDLASALQTQWTWRDEAPEPGAYPAATTPPPEQSVEADHEAAVIDEVPLDPSASEETPAAPIQSSAPPELPIESSVSQSPPAAAPPPEHALPASGDGEEPAPLPVGTEAFAALAARISGLEGQDSLLRELRTHLGETREQLMGGEARLGALEAILAEFSQTYAALNARLDAQTREIEELRRVTAEQATRITAAGRALLG